MIGNAEQDAFVFAMNQAVVTTLRRDGSPTSSLIAYYCTGDQIVFSTTESRLKTRTVRNDPRCVVTVLDGDGKGRYVSIEGNAIVQDQDVVNGHIELNRHMRRDPNWTPPEDYVARLEREGRVLIHVTPSRVSGVTGR